MENIMHYVDRGGVIVWVLIGLNILGFAIMLWKFLFISFANLNRNKMVQKALDFVQKNSRDFNAKSLQNALDIQIKRLEFGLVTVKIIASIAPLLGLLGTVVGVLGAFDAISAQGLGDPTVFSSGISVALITTVAGLVVAIPHYIGYNYLIGLLDSMELKLEKEALEQI